MTANPHRPSRASAHDSPVALRRESRGAAGPHVRPLGDEIGRTARQVRDVRGRVHALIGHGFQRGRGYHYATNCDLLLWVGDGALTTTWPVTCPACREAA